MKKLFLFMTMAAAAAGGACTSAGAPSSNANGNGNLPPEFQPKVIANGNAPTPGIPDPSNANLSNAGAGTTPTPGIPSNTELNKPFKPGATPTPGIPSEEEIRRQMNRKVDPNEVNRPPSNSKQAFNDGDPPVVRQVRKP